MTTPALFALGLLLVSIEGAGTSLFPTPLTDSFDAKWSIPLASAERIPDTVLELPEARSRNARLATQAPFDRMTRVRASRTGPLRVVSARSKEGVASSFLLPSPGPEGVLAFVSAHASLFGISGAADIKLHEPRESALWQRDGAANGYPEESAKPSDVRWEVEQVFPDGLACVACTLVLHVRDQREVVALTNNFTAPLGDSSPRYTQGEAWEAFTRQHAFPWRAASRTAVLRIERGDDDRPRLVWALPYEGRRGVQNCRMKALVDASSLVWIGDEYSSYSGVAGEIC